MNYVVYADIMFIWIFFVNYITYYIACRILSNCLNNNKLLFWCLCTAVILELFYIMTLHLTKKYQLIYYICLNILLMVVFLRYITKTNNLRGIIRLMSYQLMAMILLSGTLKLMEQGRLNFYLTIPVIIIICLSLPKIHKTFLGPGNAASNLYPVIIYTDTKTHHLTGYMDTGNILIDPYTNNPVIILDRQAALDILTPDIRTYPIPFRTINSQTSIMEAFHINGIKIGDSKKISNVTAAISPSPFNKGLEYKLLLNNNLK